MGDHYMEFLHKTDETERQFLRMVIKDEVARAFAIDAIEPAHLYSHDAKRIYKSIRKWYSKGEPINPLTVKGAIKDGVVLTYFNTIMSSPSDISIEDLCKILIDSYKVREVERFCETTQNLINTIEITGDDLVGRLENQAIAISQASMVREFDQASETMGNTVDNILKMNSGELERTGLETGLVGLDQLIRGFKPGQLIIVAGRPSMGKSELGLNIASHIDRTYQVPVGIFSLEMSQEELKGRLIAERTEIPLWRLNAGDLSDKHVTTLERQKDVLAKTRILINDDVSITPSQLHSRVKRAKLMYPDLGMVIVDYIQLMKAEGGENSREQEVARISRTLKIMARDVGIPVIAISQLSRKVESRKNKQPIMSDLRESGAIEQDADIIIFCFRPGVYTSRKEDGHAMKLIVAKQRNGPIGHVWVTNHLDIQKIEQVGNEFFDDDYFDVSLGEGTNKFGD